MPPSGRHCHFAISNDIIEITSTRGGGGSPALDVPKPRYYKRALGQDLSYIQLEEHEDHLTQCLLQNPPLGKTLPRAGHPVSAQFLIWTARLNTPFGAQKPIFERAVVSRARVRNWLGRMLSMSYTRTKKPCFAPFCVCNEQGPRGGWRLRPLGKNEKNRPGGASRCG